MKCCIQRHLDYMGRNGFVTSMPRARRRRIAKALTATRRRIRRRQRAVSGTPILIMAHR